MDKAYEYKKKGEYTTAEVAFRAFLTQYIIWYHEHTIPVHKQMPAKAEKILIIDIQAVIELIECIEFCLYKQEKKDDIFPFLTQTEDIIDDSRFKIVVKLKKSCLSGCNGPFQ